ncbi:4Fe-4S dicluster domain-containing protein [Desulfohalovibrio reitneri]|uniref:4Fe-4S dicluster domain-containing protein n=1 Tax=Desulfohalovibrio reitneri TaxID=1307759 RepID=UPI000691BEF0|nr:4Fe-4S dicluster domain-containing protein [Desulfohalovibrio reitneri]
MARDELRLLGDVAPLREPPAADVFRLGLAYQGLAVGEGETVGAGQRIAKHQDDLGGDLHAPVSGVVEKVEGESVTIRASRDVQPEESGKLDTASADALRRSLTRKGVDMRRIKPAKELVVNGVNPEPGSSVHQQLLTHEMETLLAGLAKVQAVVGPSRIFLVAPEGQPALGPNPVVRVEPVHPNGLDSLAARAVTEREWPGDVAVATVLDLWRIGRVARTGRPLTETVLTCGGDNWRVPIGVSAGHMLEAAGLKPGDGDRVALGGRMLGAAQYELSAAVSRDTYALTLVAASEGPEYEDAACINCGECDRVCPARIPVSLMARQAEFGYYDRAADLDLYSCLECGLCAWVCPARRPMLQYIRLAKTELDKTEDWLPDEHRALRDRARAWLRRIWS